MNFILNVAKVEALRKDFLGIMGNLKKVTDYDSARNVRKIYSVWANRLEDLVFKEMIPVFQQEVREGKIPKAFSGIYEDMVRKGVWALVMASVPLTEADAYHSKEDRYRGYLRDIKTYEGRVRRLAREAWVALSEFIEWYEHHTNGESFKIQLPDEESVEIEGFSITFIGLSEEKSAKEYYANIAEALRRYRQRASQVLPELLRKQLPMVISFHRQDIDSGGRYLGRYIEFSGWFISSRDIDASVSALAHEMGHHLWHSLSRADTDFWDKMFSGDLGYLDLRQVVKDYDPKESWYVGKSKIRDNDPVLYYQLIGMHHHFSGPSELKNATNVEDLDKYVQGGGNPIITVLTHPPSGYARKNSSEAFCEVIGNLVAYGPMTVDPMVRSWIKELFPSIKIAMIANRVAEGLLNPVEPPYVQMVEKANADNGDEIKVWIVDGHYVRDNIDPEFTNFAYKDFKGKGYIPEGEFWIDEEAAPNEFDYYCTNMMTTYNGIQEGMSYKEAVGKADKAEQSLRDQHGDLEKAKSDFNNNIDFSKIHKRLLKKLDNGLEVWVVNGRLVRSVFDLNYVEGGHSWVYDYVPQNEVWIDDDIFPSERGYVILHELHERNLMSTKGLTYDEAHVDSSRIESYCRDNPSRLLSCLKNEGWE